MSFSDWFIIGGVALLIKNGMKKDADIVYKLKIQGEYIKADQCKIKITDLGFGQIRQASYQTWQQVIQLERGDYHE